MRTRFFKRRTTTPGAAPGIEHDEIQCLPGGTEPVCITCSTIKIAFIILIFHGSIHRNSCL